MTIMKRFNEAVVFIQSLTAKKILNSILLRTSYLLSKRFKMHYHWGKPEFLTIEPTNLCNLKCPECPSGNNQMTRSRLFLSESNYLQCIEEFGEYLINLQLFFQGEPFIHPKIFDFISQATNHGIYTSTSTNGHFLTEVNCNKIVNSGLKRLIISVDGASQATYEKYRVGGSLDTVLRGIDNMVEARNKAGMHYPTIIIQFVVFKTNEHEILAIKKLAKKANVDRLELKSAQIDQFEKGNKLIPTLNRYSRYIKVKEGVFKLKRKDGFKCKRIWNGAVISAQGQMLPCCFDKNADYAYDSENNASQFTWKTERAKLFRKQVWHNSNQIKMCQNCSEGLKL